MGQVADEGNVQEAYSQAIASDASSLSESEASASEGILAGDFVEASEGVVADEVQS